MLTDALSETLRLVRLSGAIFTSGKFSAPWCYQSPPAAAAAPLLDPDAERVIIFHLITEGECHVEVDGEPPLTLVAGDAVLFPHGHAHRMTSEVGLAPAKGARLHEILERRPRRLVYGGTGAVTRLVCGYLACDARVANLLLSGLPSTLRVNLRTSRGGAWLEASVNYALDEARSPRPGGAGILAKLSEVLFDQMLRAYVDGADLHRSRWFAGARDRTVGAALSAIHRQPARLWTVGELARSAGTSRTILSERFRALVGDTPMQYLTRWRMIVAANLLRHGDTSLTRIAESVGYQTDTAFIRAFRREYGCPPATWRRADRRTPSAPQPRVATAAPVAQR